MTDRERNAHERLLRIANDILGERIDDRPQGPNDDAQAEYNEERLIQASREFTEATRERKLAVGPPTKGFSEIFALVNERRATLENTVRTAVALAGGSESETLTPLSEAERLADTQRRLASIRDLGLRDLKIASEPADAEPTPELTFVTNLRCPNTDHDVYVDGPDEVCKHCGQHKANHRRQ